MKKFFTKTKIIIGSILLVIVLLIGFSIYRSKNAPNDVLTDTVKRSNIEQNVLATGQVSSSTDLNLTFKGSGIVKRVDVKVGDKVSAGQQLANIDQRDQSASLTSARASLASARASYQKLLDGLTSEEIKIASVQVQSAEVALGNAQKNLEDTRKQQATFVKNAKLSLLNSGLVAVPSSETNTAITVSGAYQSEVEGTYRVTYRDYRSDPYFSYYGPESGTTNLDFYLSTANTPKPLGKNGLFITIPQNIPDFSTWTIEIPNKSSATYLINLNAYNSALESQRSLTTNAENAVASAKIALESANASLTLKKTAARPADVAIAQAQIQSALGQVQAAESLFESSVIRAPVAGTITSLNVKVGEQASPAKTAVVLQDIDNLHIEANISEANISQVKLDQEVALTFDALGPDKKYTGTVKLIDPSSTLVSGVVNYKITVVLPKLDEIKPGMTANMSVLTDSRTNVLNIPQRAVVSRDGKNFVRIVTDTKKKTYEEVEVTTGLSADGGLVELLSGLSEGQEIVTFINKK